MKFYIVSGEASGDLHASNLVKALMRQDEHAQIRAWGGDRLRQAGAEVVKDYRELSYMGFVEVVTHLGTIFSNLKFCIEDIQSFAPDVVILVDYPGFNLRVAKRLHESGIPVYYYISPQVWAWHKSRVRQIRENVSEMFVILPFEQAFYAQHQMQVHYFGHPLLDEIAQYRMQPDFIERNCLEEKRIVAVLPGSRSQEIRRMLPVMCGAARAFPEYTFVIAGVRHHQALYAPYLSENMQVVYGETYELLAHSHAAMVTSGTATLETALFEVPQVVCYKGNYFSYLIAKHLIKGIRFISLVNLIADKPVVTELIQQEMNTKRLEAELHSILTDEERRAAIRQDYAGLRRSLGNGAASDKISGSILDILKNKKKKSEIFFKNDATKTVFSSLSNKTFF